MTPSRSHALRHRDGWRRQAYAVTHNSISAGAQGSRMQAAVAGDTAFQHPCANNAPPPTSGGGRLAGIGDLNTCIRQSLGVDRGTA